MTPKGRILLIGGAEDKGDGEEPEIARNNKQFHHYEVLEELISVRRHPRVEIITTATKDPDRTAERYEKVFEDIGIRDLGFIDIADKIDARRERYLDLLRRADAVFFSGGDQFRLSTILAGTPAQELLLDKYEHERDFIIGGTSAGAMAIPNIVLDETESREALLSGDVHTTAGLGFLDHCIVDTHFIRRGRFGRLAHAVIVNPGLLGVGLGEDTAMLISDGSEAECFGSGMVVIIDAKDIEQTNITEAEEGYPVFVENLRIDLLVKGCRYSLRDRRLYRPAMRERSRGRR
jgi:cyanophycinase